MYSPNPLKWIHYFITEILFLGIYAKEVIKDYVQRF